MSLCLCRQEYTFFGMWWVGVGSEMLWVGGQLVLVLVLVGGE